MWPCFDVHPAPGRSSWGGPEVTTNYLPIFPLRSETCPLDVSRRGFPNFLAFFSQYIPSGMVVEQPAFLPAWPLSLCGDSRAVWPLWQLVWTTDDRRGATRALLVAAFCMFLHSFPESSWVLETCMVHLIWKSIHSQSKWRGAGMPGGKFSLVAAEFWLKHLRIKYHTLGISRYFSQAMPPCGGMMC